jgi:hypothetical protein
MELFLNHLQVELIRHLLSKYEIGHILSVLKKPISEELHKAVTEAFVEDLTTPNQIKSYIQNNSEYHYTEIPIVYDIVWWRYVYKI